MKDPVHVFWFRRDLRLQDNTGLYRALRSGFPVLPFFVFDTAILDRLERNDARVSFLYKSLHELDEKLKARGSRLVVKQGTPYDCWQELLSEFNVVAASCNHDYEPYATERDSRIGRLLEEQNIPLHAYKDQVVFEKDEVAKDDGAPYTVYTPYMKKWLARLSGVPAKPVPSENHLDGLAILPGVDFPTLRSLGFDRSEISVPEYDTGTRLVSDYSNTRDFPDRNGTSRIGPYLRFGLVGIRALVDKVRVFEPTFLKELIWREFFMQILWHFPAVEHKSFREPYDRIGWINNEEQFRRWCDGLTGYPIVDAGMRQLRATGYMHNRVRMITASFLCKHLLCDWRWGEAWFARHLLDYELSSNNGNWQWAAGTGCDAAPYFRVFNPATQQEKFDPDLTYIKKWVPEYGTKEYPGPVVDHKEARIRAIETYKKALT